MAYRLDHDLLKDVAEQMMSSGVVKLGKCPPRWREQVRAGFGRCVEGGGREYQMIEQNPEKPSRWGKLAREGHRVVQVRDVESGKYVAAVVDGKVTEYSR